MHKEVKQVILDIMCNQLSKILKRRMKSTNKRISEKAKDLEQKFLYLTNNRDSRYVFLAKLLIIIADDKISGYNLVEYILMYMDDYVDLIEDFYNEKVENDNKINNGLDYNDEMKSQKENQVTSWRFYF